MQIIPYDGAYNKTSQVYWHEDTQQYLTVTSDGDPSKILTKILNWRGWGTERCYLIPAENLMVAFVYDEWWRVDSVIRQYELGKFGEISLPLVLMMEML